MDDGHEELEDKPKENLEAKYKKLRRINPVSIMSKELKLGNYEKAFMKSLLEVMRGVP